ncbi:unnamed protein product [Gongylonema pulchrum]|uniref:DUF3471 domain-containing protein n=1 Tax=Gongylonema pulchrum TaxID=637853 RepID=A0A183DW27_9BILA|nr:unnamed protein product [Gongylonema pulchrum]
MTHRAEASDGSKLTLFYTSASPLSNFYPCTFAVDDEQGRHLVFRSSEHYFMLSTGINRPAGFFDEQLPKAKTEF